MTELIKQLPTLLKLEQRYAQPTIEFDSREVARLALEAEMQDEVEAEKQRILDQRQEYRGE